MCVCLCMCAYATASCLQVNTHTQQKANFELQTVLNQLVQKQKCFYLFLKILKKQNWFRKKIKCLCVGVNDDFVCVSVCSAHRAVTKIKVCKGFYVYWSQRIFTKLIIKTLMTVWIEAAFFMRHDSALQPRHHSPNIVLWNFCNHLKNSRKIRIHRFYSIVSIQYILSYDLISAIS